MPTNWWLMEVHTRSGWSNIFDMVAACVGRNEVWLSIRSKCFDQKPQLLKSIMFPISIPVTAVASCKRPPAPSFIDPGFMYNAGGTQYSSVQQVFPCSGASVPKPCIKPPCNKQTVAAKRRIDLGKHLVYASGWHTEHMNLMECLFSWRGWGGGAIRFDGSWYVSCNLL